MVKDEFLVGSVYIFTNNAEEPKNFKIFLFEKLMIIIFLEVRISEMLN